MNNNKDRETQDASLDFSLDLSEKWARTPGLSGVDILRRSPLWSEAAAEIVAETIAYCRPILKKQIPRDAEFSIALCDDAEIRQLNKLWRCKDSVTNVLSFPTPPGPDRDRHIGDIAVAYETARREAVESGKPFRDHLAHLVVHGLLHLIGFDHVTDSEAESMERFEADLLSGLDIPDPYALEDESDPEKKCELGRVRASIASAQTK